MNNKLAVAASLLVALVFTVVLLLTHTGKDTNKPEKPVSVPVSETDASETVKPEKTDNTENLSQKGQPETVRPENEEKSKKSAVSVLGYAFGAVSECIGDVPAEKVPVTTVSFIACGDNLTRKHIDEEDIENLIIQQIEFCNIILLNKASEVKPEELGRIKQIIKTLQPAAEIIECDYGRIDLDRILNTRMFNFERVATSAGWIREIERQATPEEEREAHSYGHYDHEEHEHHHDEEHEHHHDEHEHHHDEHEHHHDEADEHGHHHHHHHDHEGGEVEEYGIQTFVYYRRPAFNIHKLDQFIATRWPRNVIRTKGVCYFSHNRDMSYLFEQAGVQKKLTEAGLWYATAPEEDLIELMKQEPGLMRDWDEKYGDRMQKLVFIGQHLDKEQLTRDLDACLE